MLARAPSKVIISFFHVFFYRRFAIFVLSISVSTHIAVEGNKGFLRVIVLTIDV